MLKRRDYQEFIMECVDLMGGKSTFMKHFVHARQFPECFIFIDSEILHCTILLISSIRIYQFFSQSNMGEMWF